MKKIENTTRDCKFFDVKCKREKRKSDFLFILITHNTFNLYRIVTNFNERIQRFMK